jgi:flagellar assembly factor FliW
MDETKKTKNRIISTFQFGDIEVGERHIFYFDNGILGFEQLREFVLISEEQTNPFKWLISLDETEIGFPLLSPWHIDIEYDPGLDIDYEKEVIMVVITLENEKGMMTANMKAPIIFDVRDQKGKQIILPSDKYSPSHVIVRKDNE